MNRIARYIRPEQVRELSLLVIIVLAILFFNTQIPNYLAGRTFIRISTSVAVILVVAVGQTLVVLTRNIDLSVGSIVGFTAYVTGQQLVAHPEIAPLLAVILAVGLGGVLGAINGIIVAYGRVPSIVVTLGTKALFFGILVEISQSKTITADKLPQWLNNLPPLKLLSVGTVDLRVLVAIAILVVIVFQLVLRYTSFGRRLYAIGSNPDAAQMAGLPAKRTVLLGYVLCGTLAGLGGFLYLAQNGNITVVAGQGMELQSVAAVVVGGVNLFGGSGTMLGTMLGAIVLGTLEQSLLRMQINSFVQDALQGVFILLAVATDTVIIARLRTLWARAIQRQTPPGPIPLPEQESSHV